MRTAYCGSRTASDALDSGKISRAQAAGAARLSAPARTAPWVVRPGLSYRCQVAPLPAWVIALTRPAAASPSSRPRSLLRTSVVLGVAASKGLQATRIPTLIDGGFFSRRDNRALYPGWDIVLFRITVCSSESWLDLPEGASASELRSHRISDGRTVAANVATPARELSTLVSLPARSNPTLTRYHAKPPSSSPATARPPPTTVTRPPGPPHSKTTPPPQSFPRLESPFTDPQRAPLSRPPPP